MSETSIPRATRFLAGSGETSPTHSNAPTCVGTTAANNANGSHPISPNCRSSKTSNGWLMVSLVFISNFLVFGFFKSLGMLTKILDNEFNATMNVYILMCITYSLNCAAGPLSCYLTRRYSARTIALTGTSISTFGLCLSWFAPSITFLYFSIGVLTGIGSGITYPAGVILVSGYFAGTKNAGIANALVVSGSPIGGMIIPSVISFLTELYTSRGAFLIIGGLTMHAILCVRSFRQPAAFNKSADTNCPTPPPSRCSQSHDQDQDDSCEKTDKNFNICCEDENNASNSQVHSASTGILTLSVKHERGNKSWATTISASAQSMREYCASLTDPPPSSFPLESDGSKNSVDGFTFRRRGATNILNRSDGLTVKTAQNSQILPGVGSQPYILALDHSCMILCPSNTDIIMKHRHSRFFESVKSITVGAAGDMKVNGEAEDVTNTDQSQPSQNVKKPSSTWNFISPLGDPMYVFLLLSNTSTAISTANIYLMMSKLVEESDNDYTKTSIVYLLISSADLTGRITGAFLCDKKIVSPSIIYAVGLISAGISSSLLSSLKSFAVLCTGTVMYGFSSGLHIGIYGLLLTNIVGLIRIHAGYGISMFLNGTIQCMSILISGRIVSNHKGSFSWLGPVFGGVLVCGGLIWICGLLLFAYKKRNMKIENVPRNEEHHVQREDVNNNNPDQNRETCT